MRRCSRTACNRTAVMTLTYVYADSTAVLGPLATYAEPHCYDLCEVHGERLTAPRGWEILRLAPDPAQLGPSSDDLEALADAVREAGRPVGPVPAAASPAPSIEVFSFPASRPVMTTRAPSLAKMRPMASPMPLPPPVTTAVLSFSFISDSPVRTGHSTKFPAPGGV